MIRLIAAETLRAFLLAFLVLTALAMAACDQGGAGEDGAGLDTVGASGYKTPGLNKVMPVTHTYSEIDPAKDWPIWRGIGGNGVAPKQADTPLEWSVTKNVIWKAKVSGRGHASPTILGDLIVLATADAKAKTQSVVAYKKSSGEKAWETVVFKGELPASIHKNNSHASQTVQTDGTHFYVNFYNSDKIEVAVLDKTGKVIAQRHVGGYESSSNFGYGAKPALYKDILIVVSDYSKGWIVGLNKKDLSEKWRYKREGKGSFSTPVIAQLKGKDQMLLSGSHQMISLDPMTGKALWTTEAPWRTTCGTAVWDENGVVYASGGYPEKGTVAIDSATKKELWKHKSKSYEQSMLYYDGALYLIQDNGLFHCVDVKTGKDLWKGRLKGPVSPSLVLVNGVIYVTNERGVGWVIEANKKEFKLISENKLGDDSFATPSFSEGRMYTRVAIYNDDNVREEWLFCIGKAK